MLIKIETPTKTIDSVQFEKDTNLLLFNLENDFYIFGNCTESEALSAFTAHNPVNTREARIAAEAKLAALGLTTDDLKALGL